MRSQTLFIAFNLNMNCLEASEFIIMVLLLTNNSLKKTPYFVRRVADLFIENTGHVQQLILSCIAISVGTNTNKIPNAESKRKLSTGHCGWIER